MQTINAEGVYNSQHGGHRIPEPEELLALISQAQEGDEGALQETVKLNQRMVQKIASRCTFIFNIGSLEFLDLVQEGNIGLLKAIEKFDPQKTGAFSTYAHYWIYTYIRRLILSYRFSITVSSHGVEQYMRIITAMRFLKNQNGGNVKICLEEASRLSGVELPKVRELTALFKIGIFSPIDSFDQAHGEEEDAFLDKSAPAMPSAEKIFIRERLPNLVLSELEKYMPPHEALTLDLYYNQGKNSFQIAEELGMTHQAISYRLRSGRAKLRSVLMP